MRTPYQVTDAGPCSYRALIHLSVISGETLSNGTLAGVRMQCFGDRPSRYADKGGTVLMYELSLEQANKPYRICFTHGIN